MFWFTADEHYGHERIIGYTDRPFQSVEEMDETLILNHNSRVNNGDTVVHAGDFTLIKDREKVYRKYINRLNGKHIFLKGSHDYWLDNKALRIWEKKFKQAFVVVCHYNMRTWHRSHYNSFQLYGHSHGKLAPIGKQHDIGVDNNEFYPVSWTAIVHIMRKRPDNPNLIRRN